MDGATQVAEQGNNGESGSPLETAGYEASEEAAVDRRPGLYNR